MKRTLLSLLILASFSFAQNSFAQESFELVHDLLITNCSGNGCHNGTTPTFNVDQPTADFYADLIGGTPINPTAAAKGHS
ncbi:MAG: hypothetical protein JKX84_09070, partial [Flavobacteriales bacterium]|nr:hypothetical protein [Flavobacteriales bacterium]